jgi:hypothetical protein
VPSPVHLSLAPVHRRGWGSLLYAALSRGWIDEDSLRELLARSASVGGERPSVYAVEVSVWSRCDAQASPGRGYYYHPSRHSAGQPIVAGWAYQLIAGLSFECDSWVAPTDARRVRPEEDANEVAVAQVKDFLLGRQPGTRGAVPLFVFDAGYDPVKLQRGLGKATAPTSWCGCTPTAPSTPTRKRSSRGRSGARVGTGRSSPCPIPRPGRSPPASTAASPGTTTARCVSGLGQGCTPRPDA